VLAGQAVALAWAGRGQELLDLLDRYQSLLREPTWAWASGGHALFLAGQFQAASDWLSDWKTREDVEPAVLFDLALSLRVLDRWDEAHTIQLHAQSLKGDTTAGMHEL